MPIAIDVSRSRSSSLVAMARAARPFMNAAGGGSILALTFGGSTKVAPKYNIMGIAKAAKRPIALKTAADLGLAGAAGEAGSRTRVVAFAYPPAGKAAEMLEGAPPEVSAKLADVLKEKGFI